MDMKRKGKMTPKQAADDFLKEIIDATGKQYGSKKKLAEALTRRTGQPVPRDTIERWLHKDPKKRQQPLLGSGLLLALVFHELKQRKEIE